MWISRPQYFVLDRMPIRLLNEEVDNEIAKLGEIAWIFTADCPIITVPDQIDEKTKALIYS